MCFAESASATEQTIEVGLDIGIDQDPILARILALDALLPTERLTWIGNAKSALLRRRAELLCARPVGNADEMIHRASIALVDIYLSCLDDVHSQAVEESNASVAPGLSHQDVSD